MKSGNLRHLAPCLLALALLHVPASEARVYCCKDARGQQVCGDVLPAACADRSYRELNKQGATVRQVEAPMTEAQRAKRDADAKKLREEEMARQEQRRRDTTLLNTYTSEREIDAARDRRIADIEELLARLREQQQTLSERQKKLEKDAAAFTSKDKRVPSGIKDRLDTNGEDLRQIGENIAQKERDLADTRTRFEEDRARFREIAGNR
jgi:chromosome segregation ATPase